MPKTQKRCLVCTLEDLSERNKDLLNNLLHFTLIFGYETTDTKQLPCVTFCSVQGFKSLDNVSDGESFNAATFALNEIFTIETVKMFQDESKYEIYETKSFLMGRCYTICSLQKWAKKMGPNFILQTKIDLKLFVHSGTKTIKPFLIQNWDVVEQNFLN